MRAYSELYLYDGMRNLAEMIEYAVNECGFDADEFFSAFIGSGIAAEFGIGNPKYLVGLSGTELAMRVIDAADLIVECVDSVGDVVGADCSDGVNGKEYDYVPAAYWSGWIIAYYQWHSGLPFREIVKHIDFVELGIIYPAMHTADEEKFVEMMDRRIQGDFEQSRSRIQAARCNYGYSQSELARTAEINVRTLQEYESRHRDINKASGSVLLRLARALSCNIEDIMEFEIG